MTIFSTLVLIAASGLMVEQPAQQYGQVQQQQPQVQAPVVKQQPLDYKTAYYNAQKGDKPLLILVTAEWCPPCQQMKATTIPALQSRNRFENFHFAKVDLTLQERLGRQLIGDRGIPQMIMFEKHNGQWVRRYLRGMQTAEKVEAFMAKAKPVQQNMKLADQSSQATSQKKQTQDK